MQAIEARILRTILYADVFNFPLTLEELHRFLISDVPTSKAELNKALQQSSRLAQCLHQDDGYICLQSRSAIIEIRKQREEVSRALWDSAFDYGNLLSHIPFVEMVALTGALAVRNPSSLDDDFDYLLITKPKRVWLARAFAVLLVRIMRLFGRELCPNYVLASDQLLQSRQDLYTSHEVTQMQPIYGAKLYQRMFAVNAWTKDYLPNAMPYAINDDKPRRIRSALEWMLGGGLGNTLENWEYQRKMDKFQPKMQEPESSAEINQNSVKGHFQDHGMPVLKRYEELLYKYGLVEHSEALAGD